MVDPVDPDSIPMLTDVVVPGRPAMGRPAETPAAPEAKAQPAVAQAAFDARDIEFIAERLRARFSTYLRRDARGVIEGHCRDAIEEHTNWLVRQVTREVLSALEQEVAGWVRDAVSEELARHTSR
jgi:hypothetical protein